MTYQVGQRVESLVDAQGLTRGQAYTVVAVTTHRNFLGGYTRYDLKADSGAVYGSVGNGHLVLRAVSSRW
jgi:hypothetical protein